MAPRVPLRELLFLTLLTLLLTLFHGHAVSYGPKAAERAERHALILDRQGRAPWAYRVASPALAEAISYPLRTVAGAHALEAAYLLLRFASVLAVLVLVRLWLGQRVEAREALLGAVLTGALIPTTTLYYWYQPDSMPDLALWLAAATWPRQTLPLAVAVLLGSLNRETAAFAVPIAAVMAWDREPRQRTAGRTLLLTGLWLAGFLGVRMLVGQRPWSGSLSGLVHANLSHPSWWALAGAFLAIPGLAVLGWRTSPPRERVLLVGLVTTYLPLQLAFGRIREIRLFLPVAVLTLPLLLRGLRSTEKQSGGE